MQNEFSILGCNVVGGGAWPEQYDVYTDNKHVGYIRLRHGDLTVEVPDVWGEEIYRAKPSVKIKDSISRWGYGFFLSERERQFYLKRCVSKILKNIQQCENANAV